MVGLQQDAVNPSRDVVRRPGLVALASTRMPTSLIAPPTVRPATDPATATTDRSRASVVVQDHLADRAERRRDAVHDRAQGGEDGVPFGVQASRS